MLGRNNVKNSVWPEGQKQSMTVMKLLRSIVDGYSRIITVIACSALVIAMLHIFVNSLLTKFFSLPIEGTFQFVTKYYMVALFFLPLAFAERSDAHISADLIYSALPEGLQRPLAVLSQAAMAGFAGVVTWQAWIKAIEQTRIGAFEGLAKFQLLIWPSRWIAVAGLVAFTLVASLKLIDMIWPFPTDKESDA